MEVIMDISFLESQLTNDSKKLQEKSVYRDLNQFMSFSKVMWGYLGYSVTSDARPFFNDQPGFLLSRKKTKQKFVDFLSYLRDNDISMYAFSIINFSILPDKDFGALTKCHSGKGERSWVKKLRRSAESSERLDKLADFILKFVTVQVEKTGQAHFSRSSLVKDDIGGSGKCLELYHKTLNRMNQLESLNVDPEIWLEEKFNRFLRFYPDSKVHFATMVQTNGVDPDITEIQKLSNDPWREIRQFLNLSTDCEFVDGFIPKGWGAASDDRDDLSKIAYINGDGYYYYKDGTQRKGKRHYSTNLFFNIKCMPENFQEFKEDWHDPRKLTGPPTWGEYSNWAKNPDVWDESGDSTNGRVKAITWRKK
ncbi:hypothetical protein N8Z24_00245 [bacterium]|nr:hypothetical protein [bacterium]